MFDVFEKYATDRKAEVEGAKKELAPGVGVLVARANNDKYLRRMSEEFEKHRVVLERNDTEAEKLDQEVTRQVQAETILVGFYGKMGFKGKAIKYSVEAAKKLLEVRDFQLEVMGFASDRANYALKSEVADVKK